jgi:hypothetical protein
MTALKIKLLEGLDEKFTAKVNAGFLQSQRTSRDEFRAAVQATLDELYPESKPAPRRRPAVGVKSRKRP